MALYHPDEVLVAEALIAASFAYGDDEWARSDVVKAFLRTLPEMRQLDVAGIYREAERNVRRHGAIVRIRELRRIRTMALRRKCLVMAMDVAFSSGVLDDGETLDAIRTSLGIPHREARRFAIVLRVKYGELWAGS
jgi:hypothetical protein